ncbi:hypothetical protein [Paludisphaera rhizosphaerae]|uniref:hypothetical protein n=1 Tax=Paludisphaera rhizosphaerae TaxID=2711216 RepID=UPI0013EDFE58|nr:hypothetical protein [Paludisphaera rhizosphaerae]
MRRTTSALTTTIFGAVLSASTVSAQQSQPPDRLNGGASADADAGFGMAAARGARHLLRTGLDYIEYQEFDRALKYLREAEKRQAELNGPERTKLKQALDRAQRGTREAIGSEKPYAVSQRSLRSGGFAPATNSTAVADKTRDRAVTREGDDRPEPIRLAGGEAPEPAPAPSAASRARVAAAPAPLPEIPDAPPIEVPAAPKRSRWEMPSSARAVGESALADAMKVPTAPKVVPIEPVATAPKSIAAAAAEAADSAPAPLPEQASAAMQAQADLVTPFPTLDPAPAAAADSAVTRSRSAMTAAPAPTAEPAPAPAPAAAPEPIRLELPDELPDPAGLAGARSAPALHRDSTETPAQDPAETPAAEAVPTPAEEPAPAPAAMPVPVDPGPAPAAETLSTPAPAAEAVPTPAEEPAPTPTPAPAGMSDPMLDLPALPSELRGAAPAPQPNDGLPPLPGETGPAPAMPAPAQDLPQLPESDPTPAFTPVSDLGAAPSAAEAAGLNPQSPAAASGFVPPRATASSTLSPDLERSVEAIARRQEQEDRARLARRQQPAIEPEAGYDPNRDLSADSRMQTQIDISRAPSPAEARPINAVPVPEDWVPLGARTWSPQRKYWAAAATCHLPLYFQDPMLERYGHSVEQYLGPAGRYFTYPVDNHKQSTQRMQILQPFASAGQFAFQILTLPYALVVDPPWEAQYDLGYWRPGDKIPTDMYYLPVHGTGPPLKGKNY